MTRRSLGKAAMLGVTGRWGHSAFAQAEGPNQESGDSKRESHEVTSYVADFIVKTGLADLPGEVVELAKKSILDGLGLALCGSVRFGGKVGRDRSNLSQVRESVFEWFACGHGHRFPNEGIGAVCSLCQCNRHTCRRLR
jgi:hypothetical protein